MKECMGGYCGMGGSGKFGSFMGHGMQGFGGMGHGDGSHGSCECGPECSCREGGGEGHDKMEELMLLAKHAHMKLLKKKMEAVFEARVGKKMDQIAEAVVDVVLQYMQGKMAEMKSHKQFEEKIMDIFKS